MSYYRLSEMAAPSSLFSAYASLSTSIMLIQTMFNQLIPRRLQQYILKLFHDWWNKSKPTKFALVIDQRDTSMGVNRIYSASELYLSKISRDSNRLNITQGLNEKHFTFKFAQSETITDYYNGIKLEWFFFCSSTEKPDGRKEETRHFELRFEKEHKDMVISRYLPLVIQKAEDIKNIEQKVVKLYNLDDYWCSRTGTLEHVKLEHPCTFDTLAMDPELKKTIIDDLDRFLQRKEFYRKVGKAWKRGYLLYGPPGTGKSSLIAAMANYLKFDIYDLQLMNVGGDSSLRRLMLRTANRSILVIEDIDCSVELPGRDKQPKKSKNVKDSSGPPFSLSGLLNFIDGLWSSCGDERIIIFTTNNKEKLDPALLRPGRMDMHIHMSYLTSKGFKTLASNYLDINQHWRFNEIDELIDSLKITPAEVAEQLMRNTDVDVVLEGLLDFLYHKKTAAKEAVINQAENEGEIKENGNGGHVGEEMSRSSGSGSDSE